MSERVRKANSQPRTEFSIDASYELALFILENIPNRNSANRETLPQPLPKEKHFNYHPHQQQDKLHSQKYRIQYLYENSKNVNNVGFVHGSKDVSINSDTFTNNKKEISNKIYLNKLHDENLNKNGQQTITDAEVTRSKGTKMHSSLSRLSSNWNKLILTNASYFCTYNQSKYHQCAIRPSMSANFRCNSTSRESIYFAIKTCSKFVKERIPTIERTWGRYIVHKRYFSDIADNELPSIATGVPNTNTGHCSKTLSILKFALNDIEKLHRKVHTPKPIKWIFLSDDDTILSVAGVCEILGCFNPTNEDVYLGERYGYRLHFADGFNYITGGGGIAFSLSTVRKILQYCTCPTMSSPDDMILGSCLHRLGVKAIHSARFHQARSPDYAIELLKLEKPISFHKFWQLDPFYEYEKWFRTDDDQMLLQERKVNKRNMEKQGREHFQNAVLSHEKLDNSIQQKLPIPDVTSLAKPKHMEL